jgi:hypothetical protein
MNAALLDLYSDFLILNDRYATATGLSAMTGQAISHDKITRFLSEEEFSDHHLWKIVKPHLRKVENEDGVLIGDDSIAEKPHMDENEIVGWFFDHSKGRSVKGINVVSVLYEVNGVNIPLSLQLVHKDQEGKPEIGKNEMFRQAIKQAIRNQIKFRFVLADVWYGSSENMEFIKKEHKKDFIFPLKSNRQIALSEGEHHRRQYVPINSLNLNPGDRITIYLKGVDFPVHLIKDVFVNTDGSEGHLYLVCSDLTATYQQIITQYQRRWRVEEYHRSLKNNTSLEASPAKTERTQANHIFASVYAFFKLELMKMKLNLNHYAMKTVLATVALKAAFEKIQELKYGIQLCLTFA